MALRRVLDLSFLTFHIFYPSSNAQSTASPYATPTGLSSDITSYLEASDGSNAALAKGLMFDNINVPDSANGTVIAAQSYSNPNYAYNWVRDASLTMDVIQTLYAASTADDAKSYYAEVLFAYAGARKTEQNDPNLQTGLGEPKFNLNNTVFTGPWGRPQNDGPATAAITLIEFAAAWMDNGGSVDTVKQEIYQAPVKTDLLFVASNWSSPSFDIWEEEESSHFYNHLVSYRALILGAAFASKMGDGDTSSTLYAAANNVSVTLLDFWDADLGIIKYENGPVLNNKASYQDIAVILGVIHGYTSEKIFSYSDDQVLSTAYHLAMSFLDTYPIASQHTDSNDATLGIPIGRYPEDVYDGTGTEENGGNPWFLCTAAMAELFFRASAELQSVGSLTVSNVSLPFWTYFAPNANLAMDSYSSSSDGFKGANAALQGWGDAYMRLIKFHGDPDGGHLSEEFDRNSGYMVGAADLTWSYASVLTAAFARADASGNSTYVQALADLDF